MARRRILIGLKLIRCTDSKFVRTITKLWVRVVGAWACRRSCVTLHPLAGPLHQSGLGARPSHVITLGRLVRSGSGMPGWLELVLSSEANVGQAGAKWFHILGGTGADVGRLRLPLQLPHFAVAD